MVAQSPDEFLDDEFLNSTAKELNHSGFVSDEHEFAPYRETIAEHVHIIEAALNNMGNNYKLSKGYLNHPDAGYAYFIYDSAKFYDLDTAKRAVKSWLDNRYGDK